MPCANDWPVTVTDCVCHGSVLTGASSKTRALRSALACLLAAGPAVSGLSQSGGTVDAEDLKCMSYVCTRLHSTLLELAKLSKKSHDKRA